MVRTKKSEVYVNIVIWKNHVGSSKKYVDKFMKYEPDAWIILGSHIGFCNLLKDYIDLKVGMLIEHIVQMRCCPN